MSIRKPNRRSTPRARVIGGRRTSHRSAPKARSRWTHRARKDMTADA
jgi:hypothetical protein